MPSNMQCATKVEREERLLKIVTFLNLESKELNPDKPFTSKSVYIEEIEKATGLTKISITELEKSAQRCSTKKLKATARDGLFLEHTGSASVTFTPREKKLRGFELRLTRL